MKFASGLAAICVTVTIAPLESVEVLHTVKNAGVETNFCPLELFVNVMAIGLEGVVSACVVNAVVLDGRIAVQDAAVDMAIGIEVINRGYSCRWCIAGNRFWHRGVRGYLNVVCCVPDCGGILSQKVANLGIFDLHVKKKLIVVGSKRRV